MRLAFRFPRFAGIASLVLPLIGAFAVGGVVSLSASAISGHGTQHVAASLKPTRVDSLIASPALGQPMPITVFLPPGYETSSQRYPVLYMLHGLGGHRDEWEGYGMFDTANAMMRSGEIPPFIIVLPEGSDGYWFNHADNGARWGDYLAHDVVNAVDAK